MEYYQGTLDELMIFDRALKPHKIADLAHR